MRIPRALTYRIRQLLDEWTPPAIRDRRWFTSVPARLLFGRDASLFVDFKERAFSLTDEELGEIYRAAHRVVIQRDTDLTQGSLDAVLASLTGETALEVGCGSGYLAERISRTHVTTAADIYVDERVRSRYPHVAFREAPATALPFADEAFDTVVSTHVLEHVPDIARAVTELRRVCKQRLVVVVPRQRPYRYTFDLHVHFFPYECTLLSALRPVGPYTCREIDGDWLYVEEVPAERGGSAGLARRHG